MTTEELYEDLRPLLFSIAYRMLGSVSEAEDAVQESFLRLHRAETGGERVESPKAYLSRVVTRVCIDQLRSARVRREQYVGPWLPEPLVTDGEDDVAARAEMDDTLSMAFLVLLESLSPLERAAFLLHDVFGYEYAEIAPILERREDNCRQLVARARRAVEARRPRFDPEPERRDELAERFLAACEQGDTSGLIELLAEDVVLYGDGGGKAPALPRPLQGAEGVARAFAGFVRTAARFGVRTEPVHVNGQPGARFVDEQGRLAGVFTLDVAGGRIHAIRSLVNPDKLAHLGPLTDLQELLRARRAR